MSEKLNTTVGVMGIDIGKNSFHIVGLDQRDAICVATKVVAWPGGSAARRILWLLSAVSVGSRRQQVCGSF
jgi:hypothetical protein